MADVPTVESVTGVTDAQFKAWLKKASDDELEEARAENNQKSTEAIWFEHKQLSYGYAQRGHACKCELVARANKRVKGEQQ